VQLNLHIQIIFARSKHIDTKYNFVKEKVENKIFCKAGILTERMIADALIKAITNDKNKYCNDGMGLYE